MQPYREFKSGDQAISGLDHGNPLAVIILSLFWDGLDVLCVIGNPLRNLQ
jgi:hypothetical protein